MLSAEDPASIFTSLFIKAAEESISKTYVFSNRLPKVPWFNEQCKQAIKNRKKTKRCVFTEESADNVQNYKRLSAIDHDLLLTNKRKRLGEVFVQN